LKEGKIREEEISFDKRMEYLGIADVDYLSARLLLLSGFATTGFPLAAQAIEKLIKLFILLYEKITNNRELTKGDIKKYSHDLMGLFKYLKKRVPANFDSTWQDYLKTLQDSYSRRYPEGWKLHSYELEVNRLDQTFSYLRNNIIANFPKEERGRTRQFGTFIYDAYSEEIQNIIKRNGGIPPKDLFYLKNNSAKDFDIDFNHL